MRAKVSEINYKNGDVWWCVFTEPACFHVWWKPDGTKTMEQFLVEEVTKMQEFLGGRKDQAYPAWVRREVRPNV